MSLLLDTQLILWWLNDDSALPEAAVMRVRQPGAMIFVSKASLWEMAKSTPWRGERDSQHPCQRFLRRSGGQVSRETSGGGA
jgi:PIN domain nuclease of toxin-antitoxin system